MTIEVGDSDYEPDAVLRCGPRLPDHAIAIPDPPVIAEVLSPTTESIDRGPKLRAYFRVPSLRHYVIVQPDTQRLRYHRMAPTGEIAEKDYLSGEIRLEPPGVTIGLAALYAD